MKITCSCMVLAFGAIGHAALPQPATQPGAPDLYILPFTAVEKDPSLDWAGVAVQQNLLTDLARNKFHAVAADQAIVNAADALTAAKAAGASYLVLGTYQFAEQRVRFNGQLIDTNNGHVIGGISATGAPRDLFNLEDSLSAQLMQQLAQLPGTQLIKPAGPVPEALQPQAVAQVIQPPAVGVASSYQGSALQLYVDANRTPSTDYNQQVQNAQYQNTYGSYNNYYGYGFGGLYSPYYFGVGYGYGLPNTFGYGSFGGGYRGGFAGGFYGGGFSGGHRQHIVNADR